MTKRPGEPGAPAKSEQFRAAKQAEVGIARTMELGRQLAHMVFESHLDAKEHIEAYQKSYQNEISNIPNHGRIVLHVSGEDVLVPNIQYSEASDAVTVRFDKDEPLVHLPALASRRFTLEGMLTPIMQNEAGEIRVQPQIIGNDVTRRRWNVSRHRSIAMSMLDLTSRIAIPCDSDTVDIQVVELEQARSRTRAVRDLSKIIQSDSGIVNDIITLNHALYSDRAEYGDLDKSHLLRTLGQKGMESTVQGSKASDTLNTAIAAALGRGRPLMISGTVYTMDSSGEMTEHHDNRLTGNMLDVVSEIPATDNYFGPAFVMSSLNLADQTSISYAPLSDMKNIRFE